MKMGLRFQFVGVRCVGCVGASSVGYLSFFLSVVVL